MKLTSAVRRSTEDRDNWNPIESDILVLAAPKFHLLEAGTSGVGAIRSSLPVAGKLRAGYALEENQPPIPARF